MDPGHFVSLYKEIISLFVPKYSIILRLSVLPLPDFLLIHMQKLLFYNERYSLSQVVFQIR